VKLVVLFAVPPVVTTAILPVVAPVGTVAVTWVSELTVKVATVLLNVTWVAWVSPEPVIITGIPTGPLAG